MATAHKWLNNSSRKYQARSHISAQVLCGYNYGGEILNEILCTIYHWQARRLKTFIYFYIIKNKSKSKK